MLVALAWPFCYLATVALVAALWGHHMLSSTAERGLREDVFALRSELDVLNKAALVTNRFAGETAAEVAKLRTEVEKVTLGRAFGKAG